MATISEQVEEALEYDGDDNADTMSLGGLSSFTDLTMSTMAGGGAAAAYARESLVSIDETEDLDLLGPTKQGWLWKGMHQR